MASAMRTSLVALDRGEGSTGSLSLSLSLSLAKNFIEFRDYEGL